MGQKLIQEGLTYNFIKENPEMALKDLAKLQNNVNIIRMLREKDTKTKVVTFQEIAE